jgi:hypothetical protein
VLSAVGKARLSRACGARAWSDRLHACAPRLMPHRLCESLGLEAPGPPWHVPSQLQESDVTVSLRLI